MVNHLLPFPNLFDVFTKAVGSSNSGTVTTGAFLKDIYLLPPISLFTKDTFASLCLTKFRDLTKFECLFRMNWNFWHLNHLTGHLNRLKCLLRIVLKS